MALKDDVSCGGWQRRNPMLVTAGLVPADWGRAIAEFRERRRERAAG